MLAGFLTDGEATRVPAAFFDALVRARRATRVTLGNGSAIWIAAERLPEIRAAHAPVACEHAVDVHCSLAPHVSVEHGSPSEQSAFEQHWAQ